MKTHMFETSLNENQAANSGFIDSTFGWYINVHDLQIWLKYIICYSIYDWKSIPMPCDPHCHLS